MPQTNDRSLVEHLATRVLGWETLHNTGLWFLETRADGTKRTRILDLDSWADAGMVLERSQVLGVSEKVANEVAKITGGQFELWLFLKYATPRIICEAVALATGWVREEGE